MNQFWVIKIPPPIYDCRSRESCQHRADNSFAQVDIGFVGRNEDVQEAGSNCVLLVASDFVLQGAM